MELMSTNMDLCIIRYAEIALKGKNRQLFEKRLVYNLKNCLKLNKLPFAEIKRFEGRIFVYIDQKDDLNLPLYKLLANVFSVSSISFPVESTLEPENIQEKIKHLISQYTKNNPNKPFNTFRITTKKLDQTIAKSSHEFDVELGSFVETAYKKKVSLKEFDLNIQVELIHNKAYIFLDKIKGVGGLPYGIEGRILALIQNKQDLLACLLMMKRGCAAVCLALPELEPVLKVTFLNFGINPKIINVDCFKKENNKNSRDKQEKTELIKSLAKSHKIKEFDKKTIEDLANFHKIESIVTGQTLDNFKQLTNLVEFKPLIGMNKQEIDCKIKEMIISE